MATPSRFPEIPRMSRTGVVVLTWLVALIGYWVTEPSSDSVYHTLSGLILSYLALWGLFFLWSRATRSLLVLRFILFSTSLALGVGLLEGLMLVRVVDYRSAFETPVWEPWAHPGNDLDPTLLHVHRAHDIWLWNGIEYRYDHRGLRNETDLEQADVVVVGDSMVEGLGVRASDLLTSHLSERLQGPVANLSQSWYGPHQELELLRRHGQALAPETCIWVFFEGNDLGDLHRYEEATRDWDEKSRGLHSPWERSFTKNLLLAVRRHIDAVLHRGVAVGSDPEQLEWSGLLEETPESRKRLFFWYRGHDLSARDREALSEMSSILGRAHELCRASGARFLVAFAPTKFRVYRDLTEFDTSTRPRYWVINDLPQRFEAMVRENWPDAEFLDLTPALAEAARSGLLVYFPYDSHWSPEGHRAVAGALFRSLMDWEAAD